MSSDLLHEWSVTRSRPEMIAHRAMQTHSDALRGTSDVVMLNNNAEHTNCCLQAESLVVFSQLKMPPDVVMLPKDQFAIPHTGPCRAFDCTCSLCCLLGNGNTSTSGHEVKEINREAEMLCTSRN